MTNVSARERGADQVSEVSSFGVMPRQVMCVTMAPAAPQYEPGSWD